MSTRLIRLSCFVVALGGCGALTPAHPDGGSGGGSATGGGTATGGGGGSLDGGADAGVVVIGASGRPCTPTSFSPATQTFFTGYAPKRPLAAAHNLATLAKASMTAGRTDFMVNELYAEAPIMNLPLPSVTYGTCDGCFIHMVLIACKPEGDACAHQFNALSGTLNVTAATKRVDAGTYDFTLAKVIYEELDELQRPVVDGGCYYVESLDFHGTW